jgi:threonine dehydratase
MQGTTPASDLPSAADLDAAAARLRGRVHRTPILSSRSIGERCGARVYLKCENLQRAGSFKIRGALNACLEAQRANAVGPAGVLTYSSGNHGQAVALAARLLGFPATVVVPEDIPEVKRRAIEGYGGRILACGLTSQERLERALALSRETGAPIIPPFDHPHVIAGQSTVGLEIVEDLPEVETILAPVGGGGLLAGVALAAAARKPAVRVIGVEPEGANAMALSLAAGRIVSLTEPPATIADGLRPLAPGPLTFLAASRHVERILVIDDRAIREAQTFLLERAKLLVEPSGAAAAAALLEHGREIEAGTAAVVLSGGNASL